MSRIFFSLILLSVCLSFVGCATTEEKEKTEPVSTLPWNAPEKWEHSAPLGGGAQY